MQLSESTVPDRRPADKPFDEPWQAEAFALVVALNESGHLNWDDWASAFSATLASAQDDHVSLASKSLPDSAEHNTLYWRAWLRTLERIMRERGIAGPLQLVAHRETVRAYRRIAAGTAMFRAQAAGLSPPSAGNVKLDRG